MRPASVTRAVVLACAMLTPVRSVSAQFPVASPTAEAAGAYTESAEAPTWELSASVFGYFVPDDGNYAQPSLTADRGWLHLEARYNYEDWETGSAWFGYNLAGGDAVWWELTPMVGAVFGNTTGIAPGYRGAIGWKWLEASSEGEYLFDTTDSSASFFYAWSELAVAPVPWFRTGLVGQRTRVVPERSRHPARPSRRHVLQEYRCDGVRVQPRRQQTDLGRGDRRRLLRWAVGPALKVGTARRAVRQRRISATARSGPPLPPPIFMGSATTTAPRGGSASRRARFSNAGTLAAARTRCVSYVLDCPRSMLAVSMPTAATARAFTSHAAASGCNPGKCNCATPAAPRTAVPR